RDDPTRETARRDRLVSAWLPVAWSNDFGGVTLALRNRTNYLGRYQRSLQLASLATEGGGGRDRGGFYGRWANPVGQLVPRTETSLAAWPVEGRGGVALSIGRALRERPGVGARPPLSLAPLW